MSEPTETLRRLHRIHQQLADLRDRQERGPKQVLAHQANVSRLEKEVQAATEALTKARVTADQKQLQLRSGEAKIAELQNKLNAASSNREYQALQEQIAADKMANSVLEDEILDALEKIEEQQKVLAESKASYEKAQSETAKVEAKVNQDKEGIDVDTSRLDEERKQVEEQLAPEFREIYKRVLSSKGSDGMAEVDNGTCGGCHQQIQPNKLNQLHLGQAVFCGSCGSLLYLPDDRSVGRA